MDLPAILFLFLRNFYHSSTATPVAIDMTVVVQDMLLCFLFTDLYGFSMKVHSQEEEDPSLDQDQDWEEKWNHHCSFCTDSWFVPIQTPPFQSSTSAFNRNGCQFLEKSLPIAFPLERSLYDP